MFSALSARIAVLGAIVSLASPAYAQAPKKPAPAGETTPAAPAGTEKILVPSSPEVEEMLRQIRGGVGAAPGGAASAPDSAGKPAAGATGQKPAPAGKPAAGATATTTGPVKLVPRLVPVPPSANGLGEPSELPGSQPALNGGAGLNGPAGDPGMENFTPSGVPNATDLTAPGAVIAPPPSSALPPFFAAQEPEPAAPPTPVPVRELSVLYSVVILLAVGYFWYTARTAPQDERS